MPLAEQKKGMLKALAVFDSDPITMCDFGLDEPTEEKKSTSEIIGLTPEEVRAALKSICQPIANAATDDSNQKCVQLVNHEFFRDVRGNKEEYRSLLGKGKERERFEPSKIEVLYEKYKTEVANERAARMESLGTKDYMKKSRNSGRQRKKKHQSESEPLCQNLCSVYVFLFTKISLG